VLAESNNAMATDKNTLTIRLLQFDDLGDDIQMTTHSEKRSCANKTYVAINDSAQAVLYAINVVSPINVHLALVLRLFRI